MRLIADATLPHPFLWIGVAVMVSGLVVFRTGLKEDDAKIGTRDMVFGVKLVGAGVILFFIGCLV